MPSCYFDFVGAGGVLPVAADLVAGTLAGWVAGVLTGGVIGGRSKLVVGIAADCGVAGTMGGWVAMGVCN